MDKINTKLKPLIKDITEVGIADFLITTEFDRLCIELEYDNAWQNIYADVEKGRTNFILGFKHVDYDSLDTLKILLNNLYGRTGSDRFFSFTFLLLKKYIQWSNKGHNYQNIISDLELLGFQSGQVDEIKRVVTEANIRSESKANLKKERPLANEEKKETAKDKEIAEGTLSEKEINEIKKKWVKLISMNKIESVIDELYEFSNRISSYDLLKDVVNLSSRWNRIKELERRNTTSKDKIDIELNKINDSLIELIMSKLG